MKTQNNTRRLLMTLALLATLVLVPAVTASAATITTNQEDYAPWEIVTLTGSGFAANSTVDMLITWPDGYPDLITGILTDGFGGFIYAYEKEKFEGIYTVEATDGANTTTATFTDSVTSITITSPTTASPVTVTSLPATVTVSFSYVTSATGTTTVDAVVLGTSASASKGVTPGTRSDSIDVTVPAGTVNGSYGIKVTVTNTTGTGSNQKNDNQNNALKTDVPASDTVKPTSSATSPATSNTATFLVTYTASDSGTPTSGLASVELWAKKSTDASYAKAGTDTIAGAPASKNGSITFTAPGDGTYFFYTIATDVQGNRENAPATEDDSTVVTIDASAPEVTVSVPTPDGQNGWFVTKPVSVTITATDPSGVTAIYVNDVALDSADITGLGTPTAIGTFSVSDEGTTNITATATDSLGNTGATGSANTGTVNIDTVKPTIDASATAGGDPYIADTWTNQNVTVTFAASDDTSGVASCSNPITISTEGATQSATGTATDNAGNTASITFQPIKIDKTAPTVTVNCPADGAEFLLNQVVLADWSASDGLSGINAALTVATEDSGQAIDTSTINSKTFSVSVTDNAGNTTTVTHTYYVRFKFIGFLPPVNNLPEVNVGKAGRTYPIKWQLTDNNGNYISDLSVVVGGKLQYYQTGAQGVDPDEINYVDGVTTGGTVLRYDFTSQQFIYNWATTKNMTGGWYKLVLTLTDGTTHVAIFNLTK